MLTLSVNVQKLQTWKNKKWYFDCFSLELVGRAVEWPKNSMFDFQWRVDLKK